MSELFNPPTSAVPPEEKQDTEQQDNSQMELDMLKNRARTMGITFSNNIGVEALRAKITAKMEGTEEEKEPEAEPKKEVQLLVDPAEPAPVKQLSLREYMIREHMKLIRVRISNLNPNKKGLDGEIFTISNEYLGNVKKFIPYTPSEDGYHVPYCIYLQMKDRKFLNISSKKKKGSNEIEVTQSWVPEFAMEVLPQLTQDQIDTLAAAQTASNRLKD